MRIEIDKSALGLLTPDAALNLAEALRYLADNEDKTLGYYNWDISSHERGLVADGSFNKYLPLTDLEKKNLLQYRYVLFPEAGDPEEQPVCFYCDDMATDIKDKNGLRFCSNYCRDAWREGADNANS